MQLKDMMIEEGIVKDAIRYVSGKIPLASKYVSIIILSWQAKKKKKRKEKGNDYLYEDLKLATPSVSHIIVVENYLEIDESLLKKKSLYLICWYVRAKLI